jgi:peptidoglycan/xylan/chitin deacetylase (PgdA/CDA1 family)
MTVLPRLTYCMTIGLDAMSLWISSFQSNNPSMVSRGELDVIGCRRVLDILDRFGIKSTFLVPGHTALAYPNLIREIRDRGHEFAWHGWMHEDVRNFTKHEQRLIIERGLEALDLVAGVRPRGHVSPAWNMSTDTVDLISEFGFEFDGSRMATDHLPVYLRKGDSWSKDRPFQFGELTDIVGIPVAWIMDDVPMFEFAWGDIPGLKSPAHAEEMWQGELDYALENCPGGVFNLTVHPQSIARGARIRVLERLLRKASETDGVTFMKQSEYVDLWRKANPRDAWRKANPELAGDGSIRDLPSMARPRSA